MSAIRFLLVGLLFALVIVSGRILRQRGRNQRLLESGAFNLLLVIVYNLLCYLAVGLPSDPPIVSAPSFLNDPLTHTGLSVVGWVLIASGVVLGVSAVSQRKALGGQEVKAGLLVSGVYRYFRHPIYTGIVWISLGLSLTTLNVDGLIAFTAVLLANVAEAATEEKWDVGARFPAEYEEYKKRTRMLGPMWLWIALIGIVLALVAAPCLLGPGGVASAALPPCW
jgi:protein-S-isoprenylcysteine O-methyltransferase Ste14